MILLKDFSIILGVILSTIALSKFFSEMHKKYRNKHPSLKQQIHNTLKMIEQQSKNNDDFQAAVIRAQLEDAYAIYVIRLGWCPITMKSALCTLYDYYNGRGWNHLAKDYKDKIQSLPNSEAEKDK